MNRRSFCQSAMLIAGGSLVADNEALIGQRLAPRASSHPPMLMDMVHPNPGEALPKTVFLNPEHLKSLGYGAQVILAPTEGIATFDAIAPGAVRAGSPERLWAEKTAVDLRERIQEAHRCGLKAYAWMQIFVIPKTVAMQFQGEISDGLGNLDIKRPKTQQLLAAQLEEIFTRLPELDGVVVRSGEIYLQALPYHTSSDGSGRAALNSNLIRDGEISHTIILGIYRNIVCEQKGKTVFYRTWDFHKNFHVNPRYYLDVTDAIEPHPRLIFSIKPQAEDFHQLARINPTLMIGKHRQIIELQIQREYYGKGSYPYYIGRGVIDGWEEYAWMLRACEPHGLKDFVHHPLYAGLWTWSRGGGWDGPYIQNEFWCEHGARVMSTWAQHPEQSEEHIFNTISAEFGLRGQSARAFRDLCLLSPRAVLRGQLTTLGAAIDLYWNRDDKMGFLDLTDFIFKGLVERSIQEKQEAVAMWQQMEALASLITFPSPDTTDFVRTSCGYGRMKYTVIAHGWTAVILGQQGDATKNYDMPRIRAAIAQYDQAWKDWNAFQSAHPLASTPYHDYGFEKEPGLGAQIDRYRKLV